MMKVRKAYHRGRAVTGRQMREIAEKYKNDIGTLSQMDFARYHALVKKIPYKNDEHYLAGEGEVLARPSILLDRKILPGLDCKKKSILIGAWCAKNGVPFRFIGVSENGASEIHHVFPQVKIGERWVNADATLKSDQVAGKKPEVTKAVVFR